MTEVAVSSCNTFRVNVESVDKSGNSDGCIWDRFHRVYRDAEGKVSGRLCSNKDRSGNLGGDRLNMSQRLLAGRLDGLAHVLLFIATGPGYEAMFRSGVAIPLANLLSSALASVLGRFSSARVPAECAPRPCAFDRSYKGW